MYKNDLIPLPKALLGITFIKDKLGCVFKLFCITWLCLWLCHVEFCCLVYEIVWCLFQLNSLPLLTFPTISLNKAEVFRRFQHSTSMLLMLLFIHNYTHTYCLEQNIWYKNYKIWNLFYLSHYLCIIRR